ncbi:phosphatidylglycerophosphatase A family protein [Segatella albensis]|uniref:phosphatidylglycerophosphatase A family protein n=1 Tax=Segatella albensis TaxID=77768 RepID=UPI00041A7F7D|nr:phosphatidylglycerophosphatase A [Segatella albensis]
MNDHNNISNEKAPLLPVIIGTGLGSGFFPWGPGTAGSIVATLIWMILTLFFPESDTVSSITWFLIIFCSWIGMWAVDRLRPFWGEDPARIVIDEWVGVWIPLSIIRPDDYLWAIVALVLFRFFDIVKPLGIKALDKKEGAVWVIADDILAGLYSAFSLIIIKVIIAVWIK